MVQFDYPKTVDKAIQRIVSDLPLKDRVFIANLPAERFHLIYLSLGAHIRDELGFLSGNRGLIQSCRDRAGNPDLTADGAFHFFVRELWKFLRETHAVRVVKGEAET